MPPLARHQVQAPPRAPTTSLAQQQGSAPLEDLAASSSSRVRAQEAAGVQDGPVKTLV